jgi:hypothetical protein
MPSTIVSYDEKLSERKYALGKEWTWDRVLERGVEAAEEDVKRLKKGK